MKRIGRVFKEKEFFEKIHKVRKKWEFDLGRLLPNIPPFELVEREIKGRF